MEKRNSIKPEPWGDGLIRRRDILGYKILQNETGRLYDEAIDVPNSYTYSETNVPIDYPIPPEEIEGD